MALSTSIYTYNTSGFVTSGSKFSIHFRKLNLRKELYLSQFVLEVHETLQLYSTCLNEQKSQQWPPSIFYSFRDTNPRRLSRMTFTKIQIWTEIYFCCKFLFLTLYLISFQNFSIISSLFFIWWIFEIFYGDYMEI